MTERELRLWMLEESVKDAWWLSVDEDTSESTITLSHAADYAAENPAQEVQVLHVSQGEAKDPPWVVLDAKPIMTPSERADFRLPKSRVGLVIQLAVLLVVLAGVGIYFLRGQVEENAADVAKLSSRERMMQKLDELDELGEATEASVDASIARSERIFFITNHNSMAWPSLVVRLGNGYMCEWQEPVQSGVTMQIPFRLFTKNGESLSDGNVDLKRVVLVVPGLRKWEKVF